mgnify:CR=1 FL=1
MLCGACVLFVGVFMCECSVFVSAVVCRGWMAWLGLLGAYKRPRTY